MELSARIYNPLVLKLYDLWVLGVSNRYFWQCPSQELLELYNQYVGGRHLDIGVGTGWYLNHARFKQTPEISLMDLNENSLEYAGQKIARYKPEKQVANVFHNIPFPQSHFDSISLVYLLHCLQGDFQGAKGDILKRLCSHLKPGGRIFGATITGADFKGKGMARKLMEVYNKKGVFGNWKDDPEDLEKRLKEDYEQVMVKKRGAVAIFSAIRRVR